MDRCPKTKLDLWAGEKVDIVKDSVDEVQDTLQGFISTVAKMFYGKLVYIAGFS